MHSQLLTLVRLLDLVATSLPHVGSLFRGLRPEPPSSAALREHLVLEYLCVTGLRALQPWPSHLSGGIQLGVRLCAVLIVATHEVHVLLLSGSILSQLALASQLALGVCIITLLMVLAVLGEAKRLSLPYLLYTELLLIEPFCTPRYLIQERLRHSLCVHCRVLPVPRDCRWAQRVLA